MPREPSILLVGPYAGDGIESIERFVDCLAEGMQTRLNLRVVKPDRLFARLAPRESAAAKWLGYWDKFVVFRRKLRTLSTGTDLVHFSDQSCAIFASPHSAIPQLLTCTDLLAIRSAAGEFPENRTRWSGRQLQQSILRGIERMDHVVCISEATRRDLSRFAPAIHSQSRVIPMGLRREFSPCRSETLETLRRLGLPDSFILHVGGNQWYKNRAGVLKIFRAVVQSWSPAPDLLFVGKPLAPELSRVIRSYGLEGKVHCLGPCNDDLLVRLYSAARLLLFPSLQEGFGWPIIEAQACGCPVVTTNRQPMSEVAGGAAELIDPSDIPASSAAVVRLLQESAPSRAKRIAAGLENSARFSTRAMIDEYVRTYREVMEERWAANPETVGA